MIRDIKSVYDQLVEMDPDVMGVQNELKLGLYLRFDINKTLAENLADVEGNKLIVDKKFYKDGMEHDNKLHDWFVDRDLLSDILVMNKALHTAKKIHTNNMFSFSLREASFFVPKTTNPLPFGILETYLTGYYANVGDLTTDYLEMFREEGERVTSEELVERFENAYPDLSGYVYGDDRAEMFGKVYDVMVNGSEELETFLRNTYGELAKNSYVKIFFDVPIKCYVNERRLYADTRIFGNTKYNTMGNTGLPSGVPLHDYNMNEKKNFLRFRALNIDVSILNTLEDETNRQELFKWIQKSGVFLNGNVFSVGMSEQFNARLRNHARLFISTHFKDKSIINYDNLSFDRNSEVKVPFIDYLGGGHTLTKETTIEGVIKRMLSVYFKKNLSDNQLNTINTYELGFDGIITGEMSNYFIGIRNDLYNWYHTGNEKGIASKFDKFSMNVIRAFVTHCLGKGDEKNRKIMDMTLIEMLNVRWSLLAYFGVGSLKAMGDEILDTLEWFRVLRESGSAEIMIVDDRQFYFVAGQLFKYLNEQSKSAKESMHYLKKSMACNSPEAVKSELARLLGLYGHSIFPNYRFFNRSVAGIMAYPGGTKNSKTARDMITVGMFSDNVFFAAMSKKELEEMNTEDKGEI